ncbi:MAG: glycosyltransferase family 2 protein [Chloroflexota bacterium]
MPVYNEEDTLEEIVRRVQAVDLAHEIVIVDDGSVDGTRKILKELETQENIRVILHEKNQGKGAAVVSGIKSAVGDVMLIQDADLEYDPRDYPSLLKPLEEDLCDVVYGSRFLGSARRPILFWNMVANKFLTFVTNILYNNILTDMETGYKVFRREVVEGLTIHSRRFDFEPEFTAKILKRKVRIFEVPITFNPRLYGDGKKITAWDGVVALWTLIKYRFVN